MRVNVYVPVNLLDLFLFQHESLLTERETLPRALGGWGGLLEVAQTFHDGFWMKVKRMTNEG